MAPRVGLAWAPREGKGRTAPKSVIRAGFGMFYGRFALANTLAARRFDGVTQRRFILANPSFLPPLVPALSTIQRVASGLRAPLLRQTAVALTFANSTGGRMLRSRDVNAPRPGTYDRNVPGSGVYPLGREGWWRRCKRWGATSCRCWVRTV